MFQAMTEKVKLIFYINIGMFILQMLIPGMTENLALYDYRTPNFMFFQLLTHMFLHGGIIHLLFNMLALISLAPAIESEYGEKKFLIFYFISGLCAALFHMLLSPVSLIPMVGASGAIYGMFAMFAIIRPNEKLYFFGIIGAKAKYLMSILILFEVISGFMITGDVVAHLAHVGGALAGAIFGFYEKYKERL